MSSPQPASQAPSGSPKSPPKTRLGRAASRFAQVTRIHFSRLKINPNARPPKLRVTDPREPGGPRDYALLGDYYLLGRSSKLDITVTNELVSTQHLSLLKKNQLLRPTYILQDERSTNGTFWGKKRVRGVILAHGDRVTLGPPDLVNAPVLEYIHPWPRWVTTVRYGAIALAGVLVLVGAAIAVEWTKFSVYPMPQAVRGPVIVRAGDGKTPLQPPLTQSHRELRNLREFGPALPKALLASEDARFYWHFGVDPIGVARAAVVNLRAGAAREGASTITQQLARTLYGTSYVGRDNSAGRKLREAIAALKLETFYGKDRILLAYMNQVFIGNGLAGFEDGARFYFDKSAAELDLSEAATLVGILPAPNAFNPAANYQKALERRNLVLDRMLEEGSISLEDRNRARRSRLNVSPAARDRLRSTIAPYFFNYVFQELEEQLGPAVAAEGNFLIETQLNLGLQRASDAALRSAIEGTGAQLNFSQGAIVTLDTGNGAIVAMSGGKDFQESQFNRAANAKRQPGSTFKLFAYAAALGEGISPDTAYSCAPVTWMGQRYRGCRSGGGSLNMYAGVAQSENPIAQRVAQAVGIDRVIEMANRLGIQSDLRRSPGLVLGESEVTPLEITGAYGTIANGGQRNRPHAIARIFDTSDCAEPQDLSTCRLIYDYAQDDPEANRPAVSPEVARTMTALLRGAVTGGTARGAAIVPGAVGKTGTTDRNVDLWFIGFVPDRGIVAGVWLGNDDNKPTRGSSGNAATLWGQYLSRAL